MNIFVVATPLQLTNAIEARHRFPDDENKLLILYSVAQPLTAFQPLLRQVNWQGNWFFQMYDRIYRVVPKQAKGKFAEAVIEYCSTWRQFRRKSGLNRLLSDVGETDKLFLGNYIIGSMRHVANQVKHQRLIILDDGTDTLRASAMRNNPVSELEQPKALSWWSALKSRIRQSFIDWDTRESASVTYFSTYDLDIRPGDHLIKNDYRYMKQWAACQHKTDEVFILGQPLSEDGYIERELYYAYLARVRDYLGAENLVYLPHPRESAECVSGLVKRFGFPIRRSDVPIEVQMLLDSRRPRALASFFSTALDNCRLIFGEDLDITAFYIEQQDLRLGREFVEDIYRYLDKQICRTFNVVKFGTPLSAVRTATVTRTFQ